MSLTLNKYKSHGVFAKEEGLEANVLIEDIAGVSTVRLWWTRWTYSNPLYALGQSLYGTANYGMNSSNIYYMDCPSAAFVSACTNGTAIPWANKGQCVYLHGRSCIRKGPDGKYHMLAWYGKWLVNDGKPSHTDYYRSDTGMPGTWSLIKLDAVTNTFTGYEVGNSSFRFAPDGTIEALIEYQKADYSWTASYWTGPDLSNLTAVVAETCTREVAGAGEIQGAFNGVEILFGHGPENYAVDVNLPSVVHICRAPSIGGPWTRIAKVISPTDMGYFMQSEYGTAYPFNIHEPAWPNGDSQFADPTVFEISGKTYIMFEQIVKERYEVPSLAVMWWDAPLGTVVADYLGAAAVSIVEPSGSGLSTTLSTATLSGIKSSASTISGVSGATFGTVTYPTATTWSLPVSGLAVGSNTITVRASSPDYTTADASIIITRLATDTTAPTTTASLVSGSIVLSTEAGATTYYNVAAGTSNGATPTTVYTASIPITVTSTIRFYSKDSADNSETVKTQTFTIAVPELPAPVFVDSPVYDTNTVIFYLSDANRLTGDTCSFQYLQGATWTTVPGVAAWEGTRYSLTVVDRQTLPQLLLSIRGQVVRGGITYTSGLISLDLSPTVPVDTFNRAFIKHYQGVDIPIVTVYPATDNEARRFVLPDDSLVGVQLVPTTDDAAGAVRVVVGGQVYSMRR